MLQFVLKKAFNCFFPLQFVLKTCKSAYCGRPVSRSIHRSGLSSLPVLIFQQHDGLQCILMRDSVCFCRGTGPVAQMLIFFLAYIKNTGESMKAFGNERQQFAL